MLRLQFMAGEPKMGELVFLGTKICSRDHSSCIESLYRGAVLNPDPATSTCNVLMATIMFSWWLRWWWWRWRWTYCQNHFDGRKEPMRPIWLLHCPKRSIKPRTSNCSLAYLRQRDSVRFSEKSTFFPRCGEVPVHAHLPGKSKLVVPPGGFIGFYFFVGLHLQCHFRVIR